MDFQEKTSAELQAQQTQWAQRKGLGRRAPALIRGFLLVMAFFALAAAVVAFFMVLGHSAMVPFAAAYPHLILSALLFALYRILTLLEQERTSR